MPHTSTIAARCAALSTSIAQVIPDICSFARRVRDSRHDLNAINNDLLIIRTCLGIAQDDFSAPNIKLPTPLVDAVSQVLDSCDDTSERLHKAFLKLSCSSAPKRDWQSLKDGLLVNLRHDLNGATIVLELALDYIALFDPQDTLDSLLKCCVSDLITASDELLKRTDKEEIHINLTARDRLPSLLQAIRLLRSCITAISREAAVASSSSSPQPMKRTTTPRPDSLEPSLGESRRSGRISPSRKISSESTANKGIGTWLADVPCFEDAPPLTHSAIRRVTEETSGRRVSRSKLTPSRGTFYTDDGVSSSRTLIPSQARVRKSRSWCSNMTFLNHDKPKTKMNEISGYSSTMSSSDISLIHKNITSDRIAVAKANRKDLDVDNRVAVDRILANIPSEATAEEVEHILWEGANPMVVHPDFGYFFIRAAHELSSDVLKVLMDYGADITRTNLSSTRYYSAMHSATVGRQLGTVKKLVSLGHLVDIANPAGETPLHLAVRTPGAYEVARYLLNMGADVNQETLTGDTPLQATVTATNLEGKERGMFIELLLAHGAEGEVNREMEGMRGSSKGRSVLGLS